MEEAEHSVLTSSHFKKDFNPVVRLLLYPIGCLALIALWVIPIPVAIICKPSMALSPQSYLNLVRYVLAVRTPTLILPFGAQRLAETGGRDGDHLQDCEANGLLLFTKNVW